MKKLFTEKRFVYQQATQPGTGPEQQVQPPPVEGPKEGLTPNLDTNNTLTNDPKNVSDKYKGDADKFVQGRTQQLNALSSLANLDASDQRKIV
jgi:hypothetical protein